MRAEHMQQVERWAHFVKNNPDKWKKIHTAFINAQFEKHRKFLKKLLKEPNGFDKAVKLYGIKNVAVYKKLI